MTLGSLGQLKRDQAHSAAYSRDHSDRSDLTTDLIAFMLARFQRFTTLSWLLAACACAGWAYAMGHPIFAASVAAAILLGPTAVLTLEFALMHTANRRDPSPRAQAAHLWRAWFGEVTAMPMVFFWRQPFRSSAIADHCELDRPANDLSTKSGVILIHGYFCNRGVWNPWLKRLRALDIPFIAVNLEPIWTSIDDYAATVEQAVQQLTSMTGRPPLMVCHSMGGLAARAWLRSFNADARVSHIITIGSPHQGSWLAQWGHGRNVQQMRPQSSWLQALSAAEPAKRYQQFTCYYGHCDNVVFPSSNACLPGANNIHRPGQAHLQMLSDEAIFQDLLRRLDVGNASTNSSAFDVNREADI
jgi:triacylglycerol esterase/lipase EstA (alpha/beta hydrolase family)